MVLQFINKAPALLLATARQQKGNRCGVMAWAASLVPVLLLGDTPTLLRTFPRLIRGFPSLLQALLVAGRDHWISVITMSSLMFAPPCAETRLCGHSGAQQGKEGT